MDRTGEDAAATGLGWAAGGAVDDVGAGVCDGAWETMADGSNAVGVDPAEHPVRTATDKKLTLSNRTATYLSWLPL